MPNKIIVTEKGTVSVRIDNAYTTNAKHLVSPFTRTDGKEAYFGSFKFLDSKEAKATLKEAVKKLKGVVEDSIFAGQFPKWTEDNYGQSLRVSNRVPFFKNLATLEKVEDLSIGDYIYSLELHLNLTKDGGVYLRLARAIALRQADNKYNDELYAEEDKKEEDGLPF